ncbi:MAG TPA: topoisomerase DNA-binding C4 zinc finger domain-containing protein, partial [Chloroflexota bacterium]
LVPTELGILVNDLLVAHFPDIMDVDFTANMEEQLDDIARGEQEWVPVIREFYRPFKSSLEVAERSIAKVELPQEEAGETCDRCGRPMVVKYGRYGRFVACSGFPECRNAHPLQKRLGVACPQCGAELVEKRTRKGRTFYGCSAYPSCQWTSWSRPVPEPCPTCGALQVEVRRGQVRCLRCHVEATTPGSKRA